MSLAAPGIKQLSAWPTASVVARSDQEARAIVDMTSSIDERQWRLPMRRDVAPMWPQDPGVQTFTRFFSWTLARQSMRRRSSPLICMASSTQMSTISKSSCFGTGSTRLQARRMVRIVAKPLALQEILAECLLALARLRQHVDEAQLQHLLGRSRPAILDKGACRLLADLADQVRIAAHARKEVEENFRQTELHAFLGDDDVVGDHRFEPAADGVAGDQCCGQHGQVHGVVVVVEDVDAAMRVLREPALVARPHAIAEEGEVAAEAEDALRL